MDTFWFSAVEAEVYASSSLFTALSFWGILKWETNKDTNQRANRWLGVYRLHRWIINRTSLTELTGYTSRRFILLLQSDTR